MQFPLWDIPVYPQIWLKFNGLIVSTKSKTFIFCHFFHCGFFSIIFLFKKCYIKIFILITVEFGVPRLHLHLSSPSPDLKYENSQNQSRVTEMRILVTFWEGGIDQKEAYGCWKWSISVLCVFVGIIVYQTVQSAYCIKFMIQNR